MSLPPGLRLRPARDEDAPAVAAFANEEAEALIGARVSSPEWLLRIWLAPSTDRERDVAVVEAPEGALCAHLEVGAEPPFTRCPRLGSSPCHTTDVVGRQRRAPLARRENDLGVDPSYVVIDRHFLDCGMPQELPGLRHVALDVLTGQEPGLELAQHDRRYSDSRRRVDKLHDPGLPAHELAVGRLPTRVRYRVCGKPRSTLLVAGSGQRLVTTFPCV